MFQLHCIDETAIAVAKRCPPHLLLPSRLQQEVYRDPSRALQLHKIIVLTSMHIYVLNKHTFKYNIPLVILQF